jgi:hypothetical protein
LGNQEGYTSKDVKALALTERIQQMEAAGDGENNKKLQQALRTVKKE